MQRVLIAAVLCLAVGLWLVFYFCHGTVGFNVGVPVAGTSLHSDVTTMGVPALVGVPLLGLGGLLLVIAFVGAVAGQFTDRAREERVADLPARGEGPFAE